jgi:predicted nucleic acid-binding protein
VIYPDTSFLVPLYTDEPFTQAAKDFMTSNAAPLIFTPFHRLEFRTAIRVRVFQRRMAWDNLGRTLSRSDEDIAGGYFRHTPLNWSDALREAERLGQAHLTEVGARSGDLLHVACAVVLGAPDFVTFDQRQNALARRVGLRVKRWQLKQ